MCTGFIKRTVDDLFCAFNLDLPDGAWRFDVYTEPNAFYIGMKVDPSAFASTPTDASLLPADGIVRAHGVHSCGHFACLPYMNEFVKGRYQPDQPNISVLVDQFLRSDMGLSQMAQCGALVNLPGFSMHSLLSDGQNAMVAEPGCGWLQVREDQAAITNFSLMEPPADVNAPEKQLTYGKDRCQYVLDRLSHSDSWNLTSCMDVLQAVSMEALWPTRVSFVYSRRENSVLYVRERDYQHPQLHRFA